VTGWGDCGGDGREDAGGEGCWSESSCAWRGLAGVPMAEMGGVGGCVVPTALRASRDAIAEMCWGANWGWVEVLTEVWRKSFGSAFTKVLALRPGCRDSHGKKSLVQRSRAARAFCIRNLN
jgi:hypothetical protein